MIDSSQRKRPTSAVAAGVTSAAKATSTAASLPVKDAKKRKGRRYAKKAKKPPQATSAASPTPSNSSNPTSPSPASSRAALIEKRKQILSSLSNASAASPSFSSSSSSSWRRVEVDPDLLSHGEGRSEVGGFLMLEEISGAVFQHRMATFDPTRCYGSDEDDDELEARPRPSKRRKTDLSRRLDLIPDLDSNPPQQEVDAADTPLTDDAPADEGDDVDDERKEDEEGEDSEGRSFNVEDLVNVDEDEENKAVTAEAQQILAQVQVQSIDAEPTSDSDSDQMPSASTPTPSSHSRTKPTPPSFPPPASAWDAFGLHPLLLHALHAMNFTTPTPVQSACLGPAITQWKDVIAAAQTGSGKTLAFGLPILHHLLSTPPHPSTSSSAPCPSALILTPTRELALQIHAHFLSAARFTPLRVITLTGGLSQQKQLRLLSLHPHVVVATPGRLWELMGEGAVGGWEGLRWLVMDEADRMVEKGHYREVEQVMEAVEKRRRRVKEEGGRLSKLQHFFFSATLTLSEEGRENMRRKRPTKRRRDRTDGEAEEGMVGYLSSMCRMVGRPLVVDLTVDRRVVTTLTELSVTCVSEDKDFFVYGLILQRWGQKMIVFVNAISCVRRLTSLLTLLSLPCYPLHAEMQQRQRLSHLDHFKSKDGAILIATDVAARGLDVPEVPLVVHYQLPMTVEVYIHRCGRVARGGRDGVSVAMIGESDMKPWRRINSVLRAGADVSKCAVDAALMRVSRERMTVARKLDLLLNKAKQVKATAEWFERKAQEMDIEVDDEVKAIVGKRTGKGRGSGDDGEGVGESVEVRRLRVQLDGLLKRRVEEERKHAKFFTLNVAEALVRQEGEGHNGASKGQVASAARKGKGGGTARGVRQAGVKEEGNVKAEMKAEVKEGMEEGRVAGRRDEEEEDQKEGSSETGNDRGAAVEAGDAVSEGGVNEEAAAAGSAVKVEEGGAAGPRKLGKRAKKNLRKQQQKLKSATLREGPISLSS